MVKKFIVFLSIILTILFVGFVLAGFQKGNPVSSIDKIYGPSDNIRGWVNMSFSSEPSNSLFQNSGNNSIKLIDLLKKNNNYTYSCDPLDCSTDYSASNGAISKTFNLNAGTSTLHGLRFTGNLIAVNSVSFKLESDAPVSCLSQIKIDVLDDGTIEVANNKIASGAGCSNLKSYGCFDESLINDEFKISTSGVPYCQKIRLSESPGFSLGAWVRNISGSLNLRMDLYDNNGNNVGSCALPSNSSSTGQEVSCSINYSVTEPKDHYVCIYSTGGTGTYNIRGNENPSIGCGFFGIPLPSNTPAAYEIFAEGKKFDAVGTLNIPNSLPNTLGTLVHDYILERYGSFNCTGECVVPIRFISGINQQITLSNLAIDYEKDTGLVTENRFYDLTDIPAKVTSKFQRLYLDGAGFTVPDNLGTYEFSLKFKGNEIFSENVKVENVPRILFLIPVSTASAYPTEFKVIVNSSSSVNKYFWDFGDGKTEVTTTNSVKHIYSSIGKYQLIVSVTDSRNFTSSKTFEVNVSSPKDLINNTITKMKNDIGNLKVQVNDFDLFVQESLNSILNIDNVSAELNRLETSYNLATSESEYNQIITDLLKLRIPESVSESVSASVSFFPNKENIDIGIVQSIGGGIYEPGREGDYANAVILWNQENLDVKIDFNEFLGYYETSAEPIVKTFEISFNEKKDIGYGYFLILPKLENLKFGQGILVNEEGDYVYVDLTNVESVSFSTTGDFDFVSLPAFISPGISRLSIREEPLPEEEQKTSKWVVFSLILFFILVIGFVGYLILQEWYKRRYENYLFKNRNDLYNMINYVHNAKRKGLKNSEIEENLKKAGWSSERIKYVMRKYSGKRTGMLEISITKLAEKVGGKSKK